MLSGSSGMAHQFSVEKAALESHRFNTPPHPAPSGILLMNDYWIAMVTFYAVPCPITLEAEQSNCLGAANAGKSANSIATGMKKKIFTKWGLMPFYRSIGAFPFSW